MRLTVRPGDCYRIKPGAAIPHYFFVISAPDRFPEQPLVLVPMTSVSTDKRTDPSCRMEPGDHHTCTKESFIDYRRAEILTIGQLEGIVEREAAIPRPPAADPSLLERLRQGAEETELLPDGAFAILFGQGLVRAL